MMMANRSIPITGRAAVSTVTMFRNVPSKFRLIPGMTLEADLKVGTRSVAVYLLSGIMRGFSEAMREP